MIMRCIKIILPIILLFVVVSSNAQLRQKDSVLNSYHKEVLLNPFSFLVGGFEMGYGVTNDAKKRITRFFAGYYISENAESYGDDFKNMEGARFEVQHLFTKPIDRSVRYYVGAFAVYKTIKIEHKVGPANSRYETLRGGAFSFGLMVGMRNYVTDNFFIDYFIGGGPTIPIGGDGEHINLDVVNPYKRSINPRAGLTLGLSF